MNVDILLLALVDGLSYAGLLFLVALGLTLIFRRYGHSECRPRRALRFLAAIRQRHSLLGPRDWGLRKRRY